MQFSLSSVVTPSGSLLFQTAEALLAGDTDGGSTDLYEAKGGLVTLVSHGGNGAFDASMAAISGDGTHVAFVTDEPLAVTDTDSSTDLYDAVVVPGESVTQSVPPGGTASTGGQPSAADPVETSVTTPTGGSVTISETDETGSAPAGFELLGLAVSITAPPATAANPLTLVFRLDGSLLSAAGLDHTTVRVLKDGVLVAECFTSVPASPDPCIAGRSPLAGGGAELTLKTSSASLWSFGRSSAPSDSTPPTITPSISGTLGTNGWYTSDIVVSWSVTDGQSSISSQSGCGATTISSDTAGTTLTCTATSAGGTSSASVTVKRDATHPTVTCTTPAPGPVYVLAGAGGAVSASVADAAPPGSGPAATSASAPATVSTVGNRAVQLNGLDLAGNSTAVSCPYRVGYRVDSKSPAAGTTFNAGATIPVKFGLASANGTRISDAAAQALVASCRVKVGLDTAAGCATYNATSDTFQFDVKPAKNTTGNHAVVADVFAPDNSGLVNHETTAIVLRR